MASYLEANPDEADCLAHHRLTGQFVPIARSGELLCLMSRRELRKAPLVRPLPVADYVVGLELLGFTFTIIPAWKGEAQGVLRGEPSETMPPSWDVHAVNIMSAFGKGRAAEVVAYLRERDASMDEVAA